MIQSFDNLASSYARLEAFAFGRRLQQARQHALLAFDASSPQKALLLGDGDGRFSCHALQENPLLLIDAIDSSASMLQRAKDRIESVDPSFLERYNPIHADATEYEYPKSHYEIVVTQFFLDCFLSDQANHLIKQLETTIKPNGKFAYADFSIPQHAFWGFTGRILIAMLYQYFRFTTDIRAKSLPKLQWPDSLALETKSEHLKRLLLCEIRSTQDSA